MLTSNSSAHGGEDCEGDAEETRACNPDDSCPGTYITEYGFMKNASSCYHSLFLYCDQGVQIDFFCCFFLFTNGSSTASLYPPTFLFFLNKGVFLLHRISSQAHAPPSTQLFFLVKSPCPQPALLSM